MKLGTVVYKGKIYNLDYMKTEDIKKILAEIEEEKKKNFSDAKKMLKR